MEHGQHVMSLSQRFTWPHRHSELACWTVWLCMIMYDYVWLMILFIVNYSTSDRKFCCSLCVWLTYQGPAKSSAFPAVGDTWCLPIKTDPPTQEARRSCALQTSAGFRTVSASRAAVSSLCVSVAVVGSNFSCQLVTSRNVNYGCDNGKRWGIPRAFALGWEISPVVLGPTGRTWGHHSNDWANDGKADLTSYVTPWAPWYRPDGKAKEMNITAHGRFWRTRDCTLSATFKFMHRIQLISLISWCWEYIRFRSTWRVHDFTLLVYPDM